MKRRALLLLNLLLITLALSTPLNGQAVSGSLTGVITDSSGASVKGADVDVVSQDTGVHYQTKTNEAGYFNVLNLIAGTYRLDISAPGFRSITRSDVHLDIGSVARLDFRLDVGNLQERVTVTGEAPLLETDKVEVGSTVTTKALESLPVQGRNPTALAALQPGVVMNTNSQGIPSAQRSANYTFSVNGQRSQQNRQLLDGVDDTEGVGGAAPIVPMTDALQEYRLVTSNYDVELGQVAGAIQNFTTKSGSNELHGSAHEFNRVNSLFGRNPFTEPRGPGHFVWNQFGGTMGGPIKKNKLFLFGYYDAVPSDPLQMC